MARTFFDLERRFALFECVSSPLQDFLWGVEVFEQLGVRGRVGVGREVLDDGAVEERLFRAVYGGVVGETGVVPREAIPRIR